MSNELAGLSLAVKIAAAAAMVGGKLRADKTNQEQHYSYVSADKILAEGGQALSDNGVVVIPSITGKSVTLYEYNDQYGKAKKRYDAAIDFLMIVTDGTTSLQVPWVGMGSDYTVPDKAVYKGITSGHKYFLSKLLCIGEGNEDGEHEDGDQPEQPQRSNGRQTTPNMTPSAANAIDPAKVKPLAAPIVTAPAAPAPNGHEARRVEGETDTRQVVDPAHQPVAYVGKRSPIGKTSYPEAWAKVLAPFCKKYADYKFNLYEADGILQKLNLPETSPAEFVAQQVEAHLTAKYQAAQPE